MYKRQPGDTSPNKFIAPPYNASTKREVKMPCPFSSEAYSDGPQAVSYTHLSQRVFLLTNVFNESWDSTFFIFLCVLKVSLINPSKHAIK